jgi:ATP-dependent Lon protease
VRSTDDPPEPEPSEPEPPPHPGIAVAGPDGGAVVVQEELPETLFLFPLRRAVPFPNLMMPILLDSQRARDIVAQSEAHSGHLLLLTQKDPDTEQPGPPDFHAVGVIARILKTLKLPDGNSSVLCQGLRRAQVVRWVKTAPHLVVKVRALVDVPAKGRRAQAAFRKLQGSLARVVEIAEGYDDQFGTAVLNIERPEQLADFAGSYFLKETDRRQQILDELDVGKRLELALEFVMAELEMAELGNRLQQEIRAKTEKAQKDYFLREQLKLIRRELGEETDTRELELERVAAAIEAAGMPPEARQRAEAELAKMRTTPVESAEYGVLRNYLDWLTQLPWSAATADNQDLVHARGVLDADHYGLEEVKDRILEFLAVRKLEPGHGGSILCLTGPPGVGKTSLGRSIARAMGRKFWRFSLGGMRDEAEIKGHRRTYVGAMPGRILQGLKACSSNNPVLMLDEIDKLGADFRGDPSSALLEVLDPEQNRAFLDHYLDVPFDLSRVMFIATANTLPQVPEPLRDRMEVIEIAGYLMSEKVEIARRHLVPKQLVHHGLQRKQLSFSIGALREIVVKYTREAGVRSLEKHIARACRKTALAVATRRKPPGTVAAAALEKLLGLPRYLGEGERMLRVPGVVQGLAWTPLGGDVLFIEAALFPGRGRLILTGSLGEVMSESADIARSYLRSHAERFGMDPDDLRQNDLHVHFPAGAIPKDGPSAGIAIACAIVSLLSRRECPRDLAMTGEITLVGEVLPIGGVREKVLAAQRYRLQRVVLPAENRRDVEELKPELVKGLRFHYVEQFADVFAAVFGRPGSRGRRRRRA